MSNPKRDKLIDAAALLFHKRGLHATSLADIAAKAEIPIGNVYYYFKTKEELALCALQKRKQIMETAYEMIEGAIDDPRERLREIVWMFDKVKEEYALSGCPVGRLIAEAVEMDHKVTQEAVQIFERFVEWASEQFKKLGHAEHARAYATGIMSGIQGATILSKARGNSAPLSEEIARLAAWIEQLPNKSIRLGKAS